MWLFDSTGNFPPINLFIYLLFYFVFLYKFYCLLVKIFNLSLFKILKYKVSSNFIINWKFINFLIKNGQRLKHLTSVFTFHRQEFLPTKQLPTKHSHLREYASDKKSYLQKSLPTKSFDLRKNYLQKNYLQGLYLRVWVESIFQLL